MNRLHHETSPYLLQHADNPVDWYPWGEEALARAKREDKPILLSIGYATCHWCHVMERESFMDPDIAAFMNEFFINIKIDREERPDLDQLYMEAGYLLNRTRGWPLNCFLTPDAKPFFAGSYFPPEEGGKQMPWFQALQYVLYNYRENREAVTRQADRITRALQEQSQEAPISESPTSFFASPFSPELADQAFARLRQRFDKQEGGFGEAPKFPDLLQLRFLLHYHYFTGNTEALDHLLFSLDKILRGGIYDPISGGLARYAVDRLWRVPHFEKMLYDNALFAHLLADVYSLTKDVRWKNHMDKTLQFLQNELASDEGAFYSGLDAESEGEEGKYYTWTYSELKEALPSRLFEKAIQLFDLKEGGNWEGTNILYQNRSSADRESLEEIIQILAPKRAKREKPKRDAKILLGWNALVVSAYARAFEVSAHPIYKEEALRLVRFLLDTFAQEGYAKLFRVFTKDKIHQEALLRDYAYLAQALLDIYRITWNVQWLEHSLALTEAAIQRFSDSGHTLFFSNSADQRDLIVRTKDLQDLELASANSAFRHIIHQLGLLFCKADLSNRATQMLLTMKEEIAKDPAAYSNWWSQWLIEAFGANEVALVGSKAIEFANQIRAQFIPNTVLLPSIEESDLFPLWENRPAGDPANIYVCQEQSCLRPVSTLEEFFPLIQPRSLSL